MALPPLGNVNCPLQETEAAVLMVGHDIRGGIRSFGQTIRTLQHRDRAISIFQVNDLYVMPHTNAKTGKSSGHVVRIFDSTPPEHANYVYSVDLYILDENLYIAAFRRRRITFQEFQAGVGTHVGCGRWFCFSDMVLASFYFILKSAALHSLKLLHYIHYNVFVTSATGERRTWVLSCRTNWNGV